MRIVKPNHRYEDAAGGINTRMRNRIVAESADSGTRHSQRSKDAAESLLQHTFAQPVPSKAQVLGVDGDDALALLESETLM